MLDGEKMESIQFESQDHTDQPRRAAPVVSERFKRSFSGLIPSSGEMQRAPPLIFSL